MLRITLFVVWCLSVEAYNFRWYCTHLWELFRSNSFVVFKFEMVFCRRACVCTSMIQTLFVRCWICKERETNSVKNQLNIKNEINDRESWKSAQTSDSNIWLSQRKCSSFAMCDKRIEMQSDFYLGYPVKSRRSDTGLSLWLLSNRSMIRMW